MASKLKISLAKVIFGSYLLLTLVILPLLSPLRALSEIEPGEIRNLILPPLFLTIIFFFGVTRVLKVRLTLHVALIFAFISALLLGIPNFLNQENQREYISHLFQLASAYVMINVGWLTLNWFEHKYWHRFVALSLAATLASTVFTLGALERGDIGRLYTPAYAFIFIASFSVIYSRKMVILTILGILVSNKRGPIASVLLIFLQNIPTELISIKKKSVLIRKIMIGFVSILLFSISTALLVGWYSAPERENSGVGRAVNITYNRLSELFAGDSSRSLNEVSSGRFEEIERTLDDITGASFIFGSGAGWSIEVGDGKKIQNIHFSPLSITAVFGAPFAIFLYGYLISLIIRGVFRKDDISNLSTAERMGPLYLSGALLHSFFAYSLFIDWLVFFFAGTLARSLHASRRNTTSKASVII